MSKFPARTGTSRFTDGVRVEAYRFGKRRVLRYDGSDRRVLAFRLVVNGEQASLFVDDKVVRSDFSWLM